MYVFVNVTTVMQAGFALLEAGSVRSKTPPAFCSRTLWTLSVVVLHIGHLVMHLPLEMAMDLLGLGSFFFQRLDLMIVVIWLHCLCCTFMLLQQLQL